jgi:hypothetical protein
VYCSFECQSRNERIQKLDRIEQLITALFFEYSETTNPYPVISETIHQEQQGNWRQIHALGRVDHLGTVTLKDNGPLSPRGRLAFLSLNKCTSVLMIFAPLMAFLYQGSYLLHSPAMSNQNLT